LIGVLGGVDPYFFSKFFLSSSCPKILLYAFFFIIPEVLENF
jgi:hypothetical protein